MNGAVAESCEGSRCIGRREERKGLSRGAGDLMMQRTGSLRITAAFWGALLAAAGLYAVVALSPKILSYYELRRLHHDRQWALITLENRVQALGKTVEAFERDPRLASELTRAEFGVVDPQEQRIPVDDELAFQLGQSDGEVRVPTDRPEPAWLPVVGMVAKSRSLQNMLLLSAATLVLFGFTFCRDRVVGLPG